MNIWIESLHVVNVLDKIIPFHAWCPEKGTTSQSVGQSVKMFKMSTTTKILFRIWTCHPSSESSNQEVWEEFHGDSHDAYLISHVALPFYIFKGIVFFIKLPVLSHWMDDKSGVEYHKLSTALSGPRGFYIFGLRGWRVGLWLVRISCPMIVQNKLICDWSCSPGRALLDLGKCNLLTLAIWKSAWGPWLILTRTRA